MGSERMPREAHDAPNDRGLEGACRIFLHLLLQSRQTESLLSRDLGFLGIYLSVGPCENAVC
jgi:hypothetical protein